MNSALFPNSRSRIIVLSGIILISLFLFFYLRDFIGQNWEILLLLTWQHLYLILLSMPLAIALGVGISILLYDKKFSGGMTITLASIIMTVPSIALFGALIPLLAPLGMGVGVTPAIIALILYSQLPIIRNSMTGLRSVSPGVIKSARGLGLTPIQQLLKVRLPLAMPLILSGIRIAVVMGVGVAAVAAYVGAGGLGRWIFGGIRRGYPEMLLSSALLVSILAILLDRVLLGLQIFFSDKRTLSSGDD